jgi:hypothetical protein
VVTNVQEHPDNPGTKLKQSSGPLPRGEGAETPTTQDYETDPRDVPPDPDRQAVPVPSNIDGPIGSKNRAPL